MSTPETPPVPGSVGWVDITVPDASSLREFYRDVAGWSVVELDMGGYSDYCMNDASGRTVAGVCHARGSNAAIPPQWLIYISVADLDASLARCVELGGEIITGPGGSGSSRFCVIRDSAGAVCALHESRASEPKG